MLYCELIDGLNRYPKTDTDTDKNCKLYYENSCTVLSVVNGTTHTLPRVSTHFLIVSHYFST